MKEPEYLLQGGTRVRTIATFERNADQGLLIASKHLALRKTDAVGVVTGIVGGHGGDVYWVAHFGDHHVAAYGWWEFELAPAKDPCDECKGAGVGTYWKTSNATQCCTPCGACAGSGEKSRASA